LQDLVAHGDIVDILTNFCDTNNVPHLMLYGPPGTGKTSTILAVAARMYQSNSYQSLVLELNASDARGIDVVRNEIKDFCSTQQLSFKATNSNLVKLVILDEADAMTADAQFALRRMMEKYTKQVRFCFICNYISKIIPALQSRCTKFRFSPLPVPLMRSRLTEICQLEHVPISDNGVEAILRLSGGDMRRVLNLLQSSFLSANGDATASEVNETVVYLTSGAPLPADMDLILDVLLNSPFRTAYQTLTTLCSTKGYALVDVVTELSARLVALDLPDAVAGLLLDGLSNVEYRLSAGGTDGEKIQMAALVAVFVLARETHPQNGQ
jgi:replication factor C subunit 3/5